MSNNPSTIRERRTQHAQRGTPKSWHHRMARLIVGDYRPACMASGCPKAYGVARAATLVCEWDQDQNGRMVSRQRLYCNEHGSHFAGIHRIYLADLPQAKLSELEQADRSGWRYSDDLTTKGTKEHEEEAFNVTR